MRTVRGRGWGLVAVALLGAAAGNPGAAADAPGAKAVVLPPVTDPGATERPAAPRSPYAPAGVAAPTASPFTPGSAKAPSEIPVLPAPQVVGGGDPRQLSPAWADWPAPG